MKQIRLASKIVSTLVKDRVHYPVRLLADVLIVTARCGILLVLYWYVFNLKGGEVNGTTYAFVAWSMFFYFAYHMMTIRNVARVIMEDVQSGRVETIFSKPISYLFYRFWWQIGNGLFPTIFITVVGSALLWITVGIPETMTAPLFLPSVALIVFLSTILSLVLYSIVGLLAFWIEDINPLFWIIDKSVVILGGSYLPIALFPPLMYQIAIWSPFGATQFITHTVYESWPSVWLKLASIQVMWIVILFLTIYFLFRAVQKRVSVNGG